MPLKIYSRNPPVLYYIVQVIVVNQYTVTIITYGQESWGQYDGVSI